MKVLASISLVKHCYEIGLENTLGVELRAVLFVSSSTAENVLEV